jgi:EmrB/QacA subfamily drug resistance transporter
MTSTKAADPGSRQPFDRRWLALAVIAVAQLMTALDATIVNIALPSAQHSLGFDDGARQWVVTAYTLCFAGLLLLGGRISDVIGRRRAFLVGLGGFALASLLAGLATDLPVLIAGRALQGAAAALISPSALSLLAVTFTDRGERAKAFAVFGAVVSCGAAVGLLVGGLLTDFAGWRWCLFVNVAIAAVVVALGRNALPDAAPTGGTGIDITSAALATGGLAVLVFACSQAAPRGWSSPLVVGSLIGGAAALSLFALRQQRIRAPLLPLRILADRNRAGAYLAAAAAVVGSFGMFLMLSYYMQVVLHYSPARAGLAVLPLTIANAVSGYQLGSRLVPRVPPRVLLVGGLLIAAGGLAVLSRLTPYSDYLTSVLPAEVLVGAGMGALFPPAFALAVHRVTDRDAGVASAVINTATQVGSSIGTAVLNTVAVTTTAAYLTTHLGSTTQVGALVHGYATAAGWSAATLAAAAVIVAVVINAPSPNRQTHP